MIDLDAYLRELEPDDNLEALENEEYQKNLFIEYAEKNDNFPELRKKLLEDYYSGKPLTGKDGLRKQLGAIDLEYFGRAYLGHYFTRKSPEFHRKLNAMWLEGVLKNLNPADKETKKALSKLKGCRRAIAAPRGHAKSTNLTFKDTIHAIVYEYKHYPIILSDSSDQAEGFLGDIKVELEENPNILEDFGNLVGKVWRDDCIVTSTGIKVDAIGSGKKIRGRRHRNWRPDLIILDDIENDENVNSPEQRKKLANWFYKAVSKAGDTYTDIVYIGTMLHFDSLLAKVLKNPAYQSVKYQGVISFAKNTHLWDQWEAIFVDLENENREQEALEFFERNKAEMLEGTEVLWEEKLSYYDLMVIKVSEGDASFNSEIQNEPIDPASKLFNEEWFDYYNEAEIDFSDRKFIFVGAVDPSLGKNKKSDYSTIIALIKDKRTGYMYVYEADMDKRHPDVIITDTIECHRRLRRDFGRGFFKIGVETNQFQHFFKDTMAKVSAEENEYLPIEEMHNTSDKKMRIQSLQPYIKNKYIKFNRRHKTLLEQLFNFPMAANDDGPDTLEMAVRLAEQIKTDRGEYTSVLKRLVKFGKGAY